MGKGGRKKMKRAAEDKTLTLEPGQSIMKVVSLLGTNSIQVIDEKGAETLARFSAKFTKCMWMKQGSFLVVDESESGGKVLRDVSQVLFHDQVRVLEKSPQWPEIFKSTTPEISDTSLPQQDDESEAKLSDDDDEDGLPPLEANTNRSMPLELQQLDTDSDSDPDTNS